MFEGQESKGESKSKGESCLVVSNNPYLQQANAGSIVEQLWNHCGTIVVRVDFTAYLINCQDDQLQAVGRRREMGGCEEQKRKENV